MKHYLPPLRVRRGKVSYTCLHIHSKDSFKTNVRKQVIGDDKKQCFEEDDVTRDNVPFQSAKGREESTIN